MSKLDELIKDFNKGYKEPIIQAGLRVNVAGQITMSSPRLNYMLYGGLPRGRLIEFAGEENGGKTTTALDAVANAQRLFYKEWEERVALLEAKEKLTKEEAATLGNLKANGPQRVFYSDNENTLDEDWAKKLGVNWDELIILKPQAETAEQIFEMILQIIDSGEVGLVVIDSLGVMLSAQAYDKTMEEKTYGGIASALTLFSKKAEMLCYKHNCTLIGINQMREDMNSQYGGLTTTGGKGWKHNCSLRLMFSKGDYIDEAGNRLNRTAEDPAGNKVMISIAKTKVCKPDRRTGFYTLKYNTGIDMLMDLVEVGLKSGHIYQSGSWFQLVDKETGEVITDEVGDVLKFQGKPKLYEFLAQTSVILKELQDGVAGYIKGE